MKQSQVRAVLMAPTGSRGSWSTSEDAAGTLTIEWVPSYNKDQESS